MDSTPIACPLCGQVHTGACPPSDPDDPKPPLPTPGSRFLGAGSAGKAFADARTAAAEAGRGQLQELVVEIDHLGSGAGTELTRLHTVVAAAMLGVTLTYDVDVTVVLSEPTETAEIRYHGSPSDYAPLRDALKQLLAPRQATIKASLRAVFDTPPALSGDDVARIAQAATDTGPTKCTVTFVTESDS